MKRKRAAPRRRSRELLIVVGSGGLRSAEMHEFCFPSTLPPQPARPNARMPSAERDLFPRYLGSRKMRRFINDNFCDSVVEMNEEEEEYQVRELKGASFTNPAVLMMISADAPSDTEAKPRRRQACFMPFG